MRRCVFAILAGALLLASPARANLLTNGSFELGPPIPPMFYTTLPVGDMSMPGWTVTTAELAVGDAPTVDAITASDGIRFLDLTSFVNAFPYGGVKQSVATVIGGSYTLKFDLGTVPGHGFFAGPVSVSASATGTAPMLFTTTGVPLPAPGGTLWETFMLPFTATAALTDIELIGFSTATCCLIGLDNVILDGPSPAAAPAPGTLALLGIGLAGLGLRRRHASLN